MSTAVTWQDRQKRVIRNDMLRLARDIEQHRERRPDDFDGRELLYAAHDNLRAILRNWTCVNPFAVLVAIRIGSWFLT